MFLSTAKAEALKAALRDVAAMRSDATLSEADLWLYGRERVEYWLCILISG